MNNSFDILPDNTDKMVTVAYRGHFRDGHVFIEQDRDHPISFPCIEGWMPPAFIETVRTMRVGEVRETRVGADEAYEEDTLTRIVEVPIASLTFDPYPLIGQMVNLEAPSGNTYPARLIKIEKGVATFNANHSQTAKDLYFTIELLAVEELSDE